MNNQLEAEMLENDGQCESCCERDCSPVWNNFAGMMLCEHCYLMAKVDEEYEEQQEMEREEWEHTQWENEQDGVC